MGHNTYFATPHMLVVANLSKGLNFLLFDEPASRKTFSKSVKNGNGWFIEFIILVWSYWLSMIKVKTSSMFSPKMWFIIYESKIISSKHEIWRVKSWNLRCLRSVWYCCCCWYCFCRDACGVRPNALFGSGLKGNILPISVNYKQWTTRNGLPRTSGISCLGCYIFFNGEKSRESQAGQKKRPVIVFGIHFWYQDRFSNTVFPFLEHALKKHFSR